MSKHGIHIGLLALCFQLLLPTIAFSASHPSKCSHYPDNQACSYMPADLKAAYKAGGYVGKPSWGKIAGSVVALGGPLLAMWYSNRKLKRDKLAREYQLKEQHISQLGGDPMQMMMQQMQMMQQGQGGGEMMFPGMSDDAAAQAEQTEAVDDIEAVKAQEEAGKAEALEQSDATRQPMVMEPFVDPAQEAKNAQVEAKIAELKQSKDYVGREHILNKYDRLWWNLVSWTAMVLTVFGGYECLMTGGQWLSQVQWLKKYISISSPAMPAVLREQVNNYNKFKESEDAARRILQDKVNFWSEVDRGGLQAELAVAVNDLKKQFKVDGLVGGNANAAAREQVRLLTTQLRDASAVLATGTASDAEKAVAKQAIVNARMAEISIGATNSMRKGIAAMNTRNKSGIAGFLHDIGLKHLGQAWAGSSEFTDQELAGS